jgi:hypothetical protein
VQAAYLCQHAGHRSSLHVCPVCICLPPGDFDCLAEFARTSSTAAVNDYDDEGQAALHVAADKGLTEAISILTGG